MRLILRIDGLQTQIDTRNPELLARWLLEQFALIRWTPATIVEAQAYPSWSDWKEGGKAKADWLTDSRLLGELWRVKSPEDVVQQLQAALNRAGK